MKGLIRIFEETDFSKELEIEGNNFHYLKNVRRVEENSFIVIMNYNGISKYQIIKISKKSIFLHLIKINNIKKPAYELVLFQSVLKRDFMDYVVEKAGEIGVTKFVPVISSRSISKVKGNSLQRYKNLLINGAMQAEHSFIPEISKPIYLKDLEINSNEFYVFFERNIHKEIPNIKSSDISIFIGPEGGIDEKELDILEKKGANIISPLSSVLKAETASVIFTGMVKIFLENKFGF
jgi:16S rRNA (uracil1498-N3)-methyltransferase